MEQRLQPIERALGLAVHGRNLTTKVENFDTAEIFDLSVSGLGFGASAGMQFFVSPVLALDGGVSVGANWCP